MRSFVMVAAVATLTGCATYSERMAQDPWHVVESTRAADEFNGCLVPLMREMPGNFSTGPDGNATVHTSSVQDGSVLAAVRIVPTDTGIRAELRSATQTGWYRRVASYMTACS